ncbi:MAG: sigma-70 family RNA polymerase sigma factor [Novosphingobium sp.]
MLSRDEEKWADFHRDYRPVLIAFFLRRTHNYAEAEDLAQEVFVRIANKERATIERSDAYLFQVAANLLRDRSRREQVRTDYAARLRQSDEFGIDPLDPHRIAAGRESLALLTSALDELPERTRQIFMLFRYERIDQRTIAESFGISVSAVEKHVYRAMAKLINTIGDRV